MSKSTAVYSFKEFESLCIKDDKEIKGILTLFSNPLIYLVLISAGYFFYLARNMRVVKQSPSDSKKNGNQTMTEGGGEKIE